jgi:hypothetical protein
VVERKTLLLRIWEVPYSNLGPETGYPEVILRFFRGFPHSLKAYASNLKLGHNRSLPNPLKFIIHISPFHSALYDLSSEKESLNKTQINKYTARI